VRVACAEVLELRHVKPLVSVPRGFLGVVMEGYNCWGGDIAEVVIQSNYSLDERPSDIVIATCRAACLSNIGCQAWSLHHDSHGARGNGHCWLKHSCENGDVDPYSVSGFVDHNNLVQQVQAPSKVDAADLIGVMHDTNCWGRDLAKVAINSTGNTTRDELIFACRNACVADRACAAWTLNHGRTGMQGQGHCWLKSSCAGRMYDARAEAGIVIPNPSNKVSRQADANGGSPVETGTGVAGGSTTKKGTGGGVDDSTRRGASSNTQDGPDSTAGSTVSIADSSREGHSSTTTGPGSDGGTSADSTRRDASCNTQDGSDSTAGITVRTAESSSSSSTTGTGNDAGISARSSDSGKTRNNLSELRFLHGDLVAPPSQPPRLRVGDGNLPSLSQTDKGIIGSFVGASTGALAVGLLAGLLHPTSPQPTKGLVPPFPTLAAVGFNGAGAKSHAPAAVVVIETAVAGTGAANDAKHTDLEEEEKESPVKQWWGWIVLIPPFLMAALCCFAVFMFEVNGAGTWSKHKRSLLYNHVGSESDVDEGMMSNDSLSP